MSQGLYHVGHRLRPAQIRLKLINTISRPDCGYLKSVDLSDIADMIGGTSVRELRDALTAIRKNPYVRRSDGHELVIPHVNIGSGVRVWWVLDMTENRPVKDPTGFLFRVQQVQDLVLNQKILTELDRKAAYCEEGSARQNATKLAADAVRFLVQHEESAVHWDDELAEVFPDVAVAHGYGDDE